MLRTLIPSAYSGIRDQDGCSVVDREQMQRKLGPHHRKEPAWSSGNAKSDHHEAYTQVEQDVTE